MKINENFENRIQNIDILRGIAILFVVLFHYTSSHYSQDYLLRTDGWTLELARYGWSGVDIFFVVSGYCIAMTIVKTQNYIEFLVRRFARIYPAYVFCGLITLIFFTFFDLPGKEVDWFTGFMNLIFANFIPGLNFKYIDGIYWALFVELKFYIFFGALYFILKNLNKAIIAWMIFSVILNLILLFDNQILTFFTSISPHANFFLVGLILFNLKERNYFFYSLIIFFTITNVLINDRYLENEFYFIFLIFITSLILKLNINLRLKFLSKIGLISFSWYLIHNSIGLIIIREINKLGIENLSILAAILTTLLISIISFVFIEKPVKKIIINSYKTYIKKY
mgnify:FL=1